VVDEDQQQKLRGNGKGRSRNRDVIYSATGLSSAAISKLSPEAERTRGKFYTARLAESRLFSAAAVKYTQFHVYTMSKNKRPTLHYLI